MLSIFVYGNRSAEISFLTKISKDIVAILGDMTLEIIECISKDQSIYMHSQMNMLETIQVAIIDITKREGLEFAKLIRKSNPSVEMVIIADGTISPISYLNPSVRASSLILKPLKEAAVRNTLMSFYEQFYRTDGEGEEYFIAEKRGENIKVMYNKIIFFEAREKRVFLRNGNVEYGISETIDGLIELLPANFIRCHRSYIVNMDFIQVIKFSENMIFLKDDVVLPVSRSYKSALKEVMRGGKFLK